MAKGPHISNGMQQTIAAVFRNHRNWLVKEIQAEVDRLTDGKAPGTSAVQKLLRKIRNREAEPEFEKLDHPWSLGTLSKHPMPPEAIPKLLETQGKLRRMGTKPMTIREAQWMARLHVHQADITLLQVTAIAYALYEERCQLTGQPCDTSEFDDQLLDSMGGYRAFGMVFNRILGEGWNSDERFMRLLEEHQSNQP